MSALQFNYDMDFTYGECTQISPLIRRVIANNPSPFTFKGTGTYIIGHGAVAVIDPGPLLDAHIDAILAALAPEERISHILITHTHSDHSPAAAPLKARTGATTYGFRALTATQKEGVKLEEDIDSRFIPDIAVTHGDKINGTGWTIECVHTPGHMSNHMCYALLEEKTLFPGDHVMGWSTSVIIPPDGKLNEYMHSLALLLERDDRIYWPTHGPAIEKPHDFVRGLIAHRNMREAQILERLKAGDTYIRDMVKIIYAKTDPRLHPAAALSVLAHMEDLHIRGVIQCDGNMGVDARFSLT